MPGIRAVVTQWQRCYIKMVLMSTTKDLPRQLMLKLHRLKPDGIWEGALLVRLKLKLHRLKPDGISWKYTSCFRACSERETLEIFSPTCDRMRVPIRVEHVKSNGFVAPLLLVTMSTMSL
jgi:hypothetical protein